MTDASQITAHDIHTEHRRLLALLVKTTVVEIDQELQKAMVNTEPPLPKFIEIPISEDSPEFKEEITEIYLKRGFYVNFLTEMHTDWCIRVHW